jgi:hypothetical protein
VKRTGSEKSERLSKRLDCLRKKLAVSCSSICGRLLCCVACRQGEIRNSGHFESRKQDLFFLSVMTTIDKDLQEFHNFFKMA